METLDSIFTPEVIWIIFGIILFLLEFMTPGVFLMFFGIGAVVVGLICLIFEPDPSFTLQMIIFIALSLGSLFSLRKWLKGIFTGRSNGEKDMDDTTASFLGEKAVVTQKIMPGLTGQVELHGTNWKAESEAAIEKNTPVEVVGKKNLLLYVKPIQQNKN
jgi:inner membrane protein